jgi:hypothetical protein
MDRFMQCSNQVASIKIKFSKAPAVSSNPELDRFLEITHILKPFKAANKELCGQNYITGNIIISLINCLVIKSEIIQVIN